MDEKDKIKTKKTIVIIAGNIGAGKSTLIEFLKNSTDFDCIPEFIDKSWRNLFYSDRKRYTGPFEMSCLMGRKARYLTTKRNFRPVFFDRGLIEGREIFVQNSFDEGFLSFEDLADYDQRLRKTLDELGRTKDEISQWMECLIVYLKTSPEICFERQKARNALKDDGGELIPLEYFQRIHHYYENFVNNLQKVYEKWGLPSHPKLLIIDASTDLSQNPSYLEDTKERIMQEIKKISEEIESDISK